MNSKAIMRAFVAACPNPVLVLDSERLIAHASGTVKLLGFSAEELRGRPIFEFTADPADVASGLAKVEKGATVRGRRCAWRDKDENVVRVPMNAAPVTDPDNGKVEAIVIVFPD